MRPEHRERLLIRDLVRPHHEHALHDLGHVAQVERVVRLGRDRLELIEHREVDLDRRLDDWLGQRHDVRVAVDRERSLDDLREDALHRIARRLRHGDDRVVAYVARRERHLAAARRAACAARGHAHDVLKEELLAVVETLEVEELTDELDGRRRAILLEGWHVDVVNEHDEPLARRWAEERLLELVELGLDRLLCLARLGLRRVRDVDACPAAAVDHRRHRGRDDDRFTHT